MFQKIPKNKLIKMICLINYPIILLFILLFVILSYYLYYNESYKMTNPILSYNKSQDVKIQILEKVKTII